MGKQKKQPFKLSPEWMLKKPLDFEYNQYTLLDYLQKCEKSFNNLEIYPDFVELSLHLANIQSLSKENRLLLTKKEFESCDDEILLKDLYPKKPRKLTDKEIGELDKTIKYSGSKLLDIFNLGKSIWNMAYDNIEISVRKNKDNLVRDKGFTYYYRQSNNQIYIWEYSLTKTTKNLYDNKVKVDLIYQGEPSDITLSSILEKNSSYSENNEYKELPLVETKSNSDFPLEQTLVPIMKRKIVSTTYQITHLGKDSKSQHKID